MAATKWALRDLCAKGNQETTSPDTPQMEFHAPLLVLYPW